MEKDHRGFVKAMRVLPKKKMIYSAVLGFGFNDDYITFDGIPFYARYNVNQDYLTYMKQKFIQTIIDPYLDDTP